MARNAFRVGLRIDTPLPVSAAATQELDPSDILEVADMAEAIARAEKIVAARSSRQLVAQPSRPDIFDTLGQPADGRPSVEAREVGEAVEARESRATDDTAGPATAAPPSTPIPPPMAIAQRFITIPAAPRTPPPVPTAREEDAFYHPVGRMRSLADATLDGYRPEPTMLVRAASRRKRFSWVFLALLLPLVVLAAFAISANIDAAPESVAKRSPAVATNGRTPIATTAAALKTMPAATTAPASGVKTAPVFDVNSLPSAGPLRTNR